MRERERRKGNGGQKTDVLEGRGSWREDKEDKRGGGVITNSRKCVIKEIY